MIKILFVCHGNICRSTMAQFMFQDMVNTLGIEKEFHIDSAATSTEEIGNGPHYGTIAKMQEVGVPVLHHRARQMRKKEYDDWDYIIGMDKWNLRNIMRIVKNDPDHKVSLLLDYSENPRDIADPWYTGNFDVTYRDICEGLEGFMEYLKKEKKVYV